MSIQIIIMQQCNYISDQLDKQLSKYTKIITIHDVCFIYNILFYI